MIPPVVRVCHANTRWAAPLKTNSHPTNTATAIPASGGTTMARNPATIINTLSAMDQPSDFFKITGAITGTVLMILPPDLHSEFRYFGSAENCFPWGFFGVRAIRPRVRYAELSLAIALIRGSHHEESFAVMNDAKQGLAFYFRGEVVEVGRGVNVMAIDAQDAITLFEVLSGRVVWIDVGDHDAVHIGCYSQLLTNPRRKVLHDNASQGARRGRPSAAGSISEIGRSGTVHFPSDSEHPKPGTPALLKPGHSHFAATYKQVALTQSKLRSNLPTTFFSSCVPKPRAGRVQFIKRRRGSQFSACVCVAGVGATPGDSGELFAVEPE